ncbi:hypothetical protein [Streptomyces abikoensis]
MVALASAVALAVVLPLAAATAGPAGLQGPEAAREEGAGKRSGADSGLRLGQGKAAAGHADESAGSGNGSGGGPELGRDLGKDFGKGLGKGLGRDQGRGADAGAGGWPAASLPLASARCGPELTSPEGVEAQTCVLEQGNETWARTYYRNATGAPLRAVLTLMAPDARTVQVHCRTTASDDPDECETPRARTVRGAEAARAAARGEDPYTAVAEIASEGTGDGGEGGRLLLRSGSSSNSSEERG